MTSAGSSGRRRRHRRSGPWQRFIRWLAPDRHPIRAGALGAGVVVAVIAVVLALGGILGGSPGASAPPSGSPPGSGIAGQTASPTLVPIPTPTGTLPVIPTASPSPSPSGPATGTVARRIRIDRLGIDLRIVEGDGIDAPLNKAAHYPETAWPGAGSNTYIYAHAQAGMFLSLWDARVGDEVDLDLVDGTVARYVVTQVKPRVPWNALEYLDPTPTERLTLQTSTSYTATAPRFIVIAEPAP